MNYGLYIAASGALTNMARQDVISNNLANVNTAAFKPDVFAIRQRDVVRVEDRLPFVDSNKLLEKLGAGVFPSRTLVDTSSESAESTGNPLDLAIDGEGFFQVASPGEDGLALSRDGRLAVNAQGRLVTAAGGLPVLNAQGQPIEVDRAAPVEIRADGEVVQNGQSVGRVRLVTVAEPSKLVKAGEGVLRVPAEQAGSLRDAGGTLRQFSLERSGTDAIKAMMQITSASNAVSSNLGMIANINELMGRAINTLGRVT